MKTPLAVALLALAAAASLAACGRPARSEAAFAGEPEIVAATFASAWCSSCKILQPKLARIIPEFAGAPVAFVEFDFTFGDRAETAAKAERHGVSDIYERNKGATGFTLLIDAETGDILDTLTMNFSEDAMRGALGRAIEIASSTDESRAVAGDEN